MSLKGKASFLQIINEILTRFPIPARDILAWQQEHHLLKAKCAIKQQAPYISNPHVLMSTDYKPFPTTTCKENKSKGVQPL